MKVVKLNNKRIPAFKEYFNKYSKAQDESYPPQADYSISKNEPVFILLDHTGNIAGVAALMMSHVYKETGSARFRMFHCVEQLAVNYKILLNEILKFTKGLKSIYCFTEENQCAMCNVWEEIGFYAKRYAWILNRNAILNENPVFLNGYELKPFRTGIDEEALCYVINDAFGNSFGHVKMNSERIKMLQNESSYIDGGILLLWKDKKPVGSISLTSDMDDGIMTLFIDGIAVIHSQQGKGLGKNLLRSGIEFAVKKGYTKVKLSVNTKNEKAAELYFKEGFIKEALYKSYYYDI
ncbi:MAG: GNAT family N-acetyltransferase [Ignavibacteria bacterium]|nr:GNAT family N-acetyltransferase [Ignavibacteria bacterium]